MIRARRLFAISILLAVSACATLPEDPVDRAEVLKLNDPFEPANRRIYEFNRGFRETIVDPIAAVYNSAGFKPVRVPLQNVLQNLRSPSVFINDVAQGRPCAASITFARFLVNSTAGLGGILDIAKSEPGLQAHDNSVAQTLAVWGTPEGPYIVLPVLGPSNGQGVAGLAIEFAYDPTDQAIAALGPGSLTLARTGAELVDRQASSAPDLAALERTSLDGYAALRSAFRQALKEDRKLPACPAGSQRPATVVGGH